VSYLQPAWLTPRARFLSLPPSPSPLARPPNPSPPLPPPTAPGGGGGRDGGGAAAGQALRGGLLALAGRCRQLLLPLERRVLHHVPLVHGRLLAGLRMGACVHACVCVCAWVLCWHCRDQRPLVYCGAWAAATTTAPARECPTSTVPPHRARCFACTGRRPLHPFAAPWHARRHAPRTQ
jgi:hypothetical protein